MKNDKPYFENLDAIRFIAAMMVFLHHAFGHCIGTLLKPGSVSEKIFLVISNGQAAVSSFFVLSGFLITYLLIEEYQKQSGINLKQFYLRRLLRIWPLYFTILIFSFGLLPLLRFYSGTAHPVCSDLRYYFTFLGNFDVIRIEKFHSGCDELSQTITWSVAIEEQFYLFWPLLFLLPRKNWLYGIGLAVLFSVGFRLWHHDDFLTLYFHSLSVLADLALGGLTAYLILSYGQVKSFFEKSDTYTHLALFTLAFCLLFWNYRILSFEYGNAIARVGCSIIFAMIIGSQAMTKSHSVLNHKNLRFASRWGRYTYGIYLIHPIAIALVGMAMHLVQCDKNRYSDFIVGTMAFLLTLLLSRMSYRYLEGPFLKMKQDWSITAKKK